MFMPLRLSFALFLGVAIAHPAAHAADNTRYVSINGKNTHPCTLALPCRTLQFAINVAPAGGEVQILDPGFYGNNANIKKSLTITGNGNTVYLGGILTIDRADAVVALRGLALDGQGSILHGINIVDAAKVHIERCVIHGFTSQGILSTATDVEVFVLDTISRDNGGSGFNLFNISTGGQRTTIDNSRFEGNGANGIIIQSGRATISRSIASNNASDGIVSHIAPVTVAVRETTVAHNGNDGFTARGLMTVDSSVAFGNFRGLSGSNLSGSLARISNSTFTGNVAGIVTSGGVVETRSNNTVEGNTTDVSGALTPITGK